MIHNPLVWLKKKVWFSKKKSAFIFARLVKRRLSNIMPDKECAFANSDSLSLTALP